MSTKAGVGAGQPSRSVQRAQFAQRAGAEAREHHEAVDRNSALPALDQRASGRRPRAASCWPRPAARRRRDLAVSAAPRRRRAPARATTTAARPRRGRARPSAAVGSTSHAPGLRVGLRQQRRRRRRAAPHQSRISCGLQADDRQALGHAARDLAVQPGRARARAQQAAASAARPRGSRRRARVQVSAMHAASILSRCCSPAWLEPLDPRRARCRACARSATAGAAQRVCAACVERFAGAVPRCRALRAASCRPASPVCGACLTDPPPFDARARGGRLRATRGTA